MYNDKYAKDYLDLLNENKTNSKKEYEKFLDLRKDYKATYKNEPVPTLFQPFFYDKNTEKHFREDSKILMDIADKVTKLYLDDPTYRKEFNFDNLTEKLILHDPGYDIPVPIARFDVFFDEKDDYKFCEFNTDGSSAMLEDYALFSIYKNLDIYKKLENKYEIMHVDLLNTLVDEILAIYEKTGKKAKPNVVIADIIDGENNEFDFFKELFEKRGLNCKIADIRDFKIKENESYVDGMKVDIVYRRLVTGDLQSVKDDAKNFIDGYFNDHFVTIGSFRSTLFYTKDIFRILRDEKTKKALNEKENAFVSKHIPYTKIFDYNKDVEEVIKNKDKYILKPKDGYASKGVFVGRDYNEEELKNKLDSIKNESYIYQEYYDVNPAKFAVWEDEKFKLKDFSFVTGLFIYNKKFTGLYNRIGQDHIISSARDYYTVISIRLNEK